MPPKDPRLRAQERRMEPVWQDPANRECFECTSKQPRWAATNLGVLFCLRCAGIHRGLGVHISKVKSTKMDVWDEDMIQTLERIGNRNGVLLYEAKVPAGWKKPTENTDTAEVTRILTDKYVRRKWVADDFEVVRESIMMNPPQSAPARSAPAPSFVAPLGSTGSMSPATPANTPVAGPVAGNNDWGEFAMSPAAPATPVSSPAVGPPNPTPTKSAAADDFWNSFQPTAPSRQQQSAAPQQVQTQPTQPVQQAPQQNATPSLLDFGTSNGASTDSRNNHTASIMEAFQTAPRLPGSIPPPQQQQQQQQQPGFAPQQQQSWGSPQQQQPMQQQGQWAPQQQPQQRMQQSPGGNEWGGFSSSSTPTTPAAVTSAAAQQQQGSRSSQTQNIMDAFQQQPQQQVGSPAAHYGNPHHSGPSPVWGQPPQQQPQQQQQTLAGFF